MRKSKTNSCAGDEFNIVDLAERTLIVENEDRRKAALERLALLTWTLPPDYKFDRDKANRQKYFDTTRESWLWAGWV